MAAKEEDFKKEHINYLARMEKTNFVKTSMTEYVKAMANWKYPMIPGFLISALASCFAQCQL